MFLKQTTYKPRSNSGSKDIPAGTILPKEDPAKPASPTAAAATAGGGAVSAAAAGRRRSSAGQGAFAGLQGMKRNSQDASGGDRKASFADQKPGGGGLLGGMWTSFTKGT